MTSESLSDQQNQIHHENSRNLIFAKHEHNKEGEIQSSKIVKGASPISTEREVREYERHSIGAGQASRTRYVIPHPPKLRRLFERDLRDL